jgi:hypothetical protein
MTGRKTLGEVRAELESALGSGPAGDSQVVKALRQFLAGAKKGKSPRRPSRNSGRKTRRTSSP